MNHPDVLRLRRVMAASLAALLTVTVSACVRPTVQATVENPADAPVHQLWQEPGDVTVRDLFYGPGGRELMPDGSQPFVFVAADPSGYSDGYDVRDLDGLAWSVKLGPEAQPEVVVSRVLWAIGYHQPPVYYLPAWTMTGQQPAAQPAGRFRAEPDAWDVVGEWSWYENDFVQTQPFKGLVVTNLLLNNWDWKTSNNKVYEVARPDGRRERVFVVRDVGASLGKTTFPALLNWFPMRGLGQGSRNDLEGFESQGFIKSAVGPRVEFHYRGIHGSLVDEISREDVVWTSRLLARLSDRQWGDAFRAAGYSDEEVRRYVAKITSKVAEGLALARG